MGKKIKDSKKVVQKTEEVDVQVEKPVESEKVRQKRENAKKLEKQIKKMNASVLSSFDLK